MGNSTLAITHYFLPSLFTHLLTYPLVQDGWLGKQVPQEYLDELKGLSEGGRKAGFGTSHNSNSDVGTIAKRSIVLANLPGSLKDFKYVFEDERQPIDAGDWSIITKLKTGLTCSFFGVFGARTHNSQLYFGRNLDWLTDTGALLTHSLTHSLTHALTHARHHFYLLRVTNFIARLPRHR